MNTHRADEPAETEDPPTTPARWITSPATRRWLYGIAATLVPLAIILGYLDDTTGGAVLSVIAAVLATGSGALAAANTPRD